MKLLYAALALSAPLDTVPGIPSGKKPRPPESLWYLTLEAETALKCQGGWVGTASQVGGEVWSLAEQMG